MKLDELSTKLESILQKYGESFAGKLFGEESSEEDDLMLAFGLTQMTKVENKQYWGRELGMCWQLITSEVFKAHCNNYKGPVREGADEMCDFVVGKTAIDTKYRIGSGDSGTLKKFKQYAGKLRATGYVPRILILRNDNLPAAIAACTVGGWEITWGAASYEYIFETTGFNLQSWLKERKNMFAVKQKE